MQVSCINKDRINADYMAQSKHFFFFVYLFLNDFQRILTKPTPFRTVVYDDGNSGRVFLSSICIFLFLLSVI